MSISPQTAASSECDCLTLRDLINLDLTGLTSQVLAWLIIFISFWGVRIHFLLHLIPSLWLSPTLTTFN